MIDLNEMKRLFRMRGIVLDMDEVYSALNDLKEGHVIGEVGIILHELLQKSEK